jgi:hypothetical protein
MNNVLFDTGCASTVFDTDLVTNIGLYLDIINGTAKRMYGVGGASELCYEQVVEGLQIGTMILPTFKMQLGMTREPYGFDGILATPMPSNLPPTDITAEYSEPVRIADILLLESFRHRQDTFVHEQYFSVVDGKEKIIRKNEPAEDQTWILLN